MPDDVRRLGGPTAVGTTATTIITVAAGTYETIKNVRVANTTGGNIRIRYSIGALGTATALAYDIDVPANGVVNDALGQVLAPAETFQAQAAALGLTITVSGVRST